MKKIVIDGIEITLSKKRIKNLYIRIKPPDGEVHISAPHRMSLEQIKLLANGKMEWIIAKRQKFVKQASRADLSYVTGEQIPFLGASYKLDVLNSKKITVTFSQEQIQLHIPENSTEEQRKKALEAWYRRMLMQEAAQMTEKWRKIMGVHPSGLGIRNMKTRWGTCNVKTRKIWLSLRLVQKAPEYLEYVVVHELVHLLERSHNKIFKGYMDRFLPQWRTIRKELNQGI